MTTTTVSVQLDADAARIYESSGQQEQAKLRLLFSVLLREFAGSARTLDVIMDDIGARAVALGLTEERLKAMLDASWTAQIRPRHQCGGADCIISGDKDLLDLAPFREIPILTPGQFLRREWRSEQD